MEISYINSENKFGRTRLVNNISLMLLETLSLTSGSRLQYASPLIW